MKLRPIFRLGYRIATLRDGTEISKDAVARHRASHVSPHTATALATARKIMALLNQAETASMWNATLVTLKEARHCMEELLMQLKIER